MEFHLQLCSYFPANRHFDLGYENLLRLYFALVDLWIDRDTDLLTLSAPIHLGQLLRYRRPTLLIGIVFLCVLINDHVLALQKFDFHFYDLGRRRDHLQVVMVRVAIVIEKFLQDNSRCDLMLHILVHFLQVEE